MWPGERGETTRDSPLDNNKNSARAGEEYEVGRIECADDDWVSQYLLRIRPALDEGGKVVKETSVLVHPPCAA